MSLRPLPEPLRPFQPLEVLPHGCGQLRLISDQCTRNTSKLTSSRRVIGPSAVDCSTWAAHVGAIGALSLVVLICVLIGLLGAGWEGAAPRQTVRGLAPGVIKRGESGEQSVRVWFCWSHTVTRRPKGSRMALSELSSLPCSKSSVSHTFAGSDGGIRADEDRYRG